MRNKTWLTTAGLAVCLLGAAACSSEDSTTGDGADTTQGASAAPGDEDGASATDDSAGATDDGAAATDDGAAATQGAAPEADLSDVPDVVAEVNGTEISKDEFAENYQTSYEQAQMTAEMSGEEVDEESLKQETIEGMISNELLLQAADEKGYEVSAEDIEAELEELATNSGLGSTEEFIAALEEQGIAADEVDAEVEKKIKVDRLIEEDLDIQEPTDEEIQEYYDELAAQQGGGDSESGSTGSALPPLDEVKDQIADALTAEQENEAITQLVEELRAEADVTVHL